MDASRCAISVACFQAEEQAFGDDPERSQKRTCVSPASLLCAHPSFVALCLLAPSECSANAENESVHRTRACAPLPPVSWSLVFVCLFFLRGVVGLHEFGESTAITHRLNDWALLMHLSSPFWSRQPSDRGSSACIQEGIYSVCLFCRRLLLVHQRVESTADRRCCRHVLIARLWRTVA